MHKKSDFENAIEQALITQDGNQLRNAKAGVVVNWAQARREITA